MKLLICPDARVEVETKKGRLSLRDLYLILCLKAHRNPPEVGRTAGISHSLEYSIRKGNNQSLRTFFGLIDELGFEIVIREKENI